MRSILFAAFACLASLATPVAAQDWEYLGNGRLFSNDGLGDGQDRWRTGAYAMSFMFGPGGTLALPEDPGALVELRYSNRILAPANLVTPAPGDRRYAEIAAIGAYTHFAQGGMEFSLGAEAVVSGPITGLSWLQTRAHNLVGSDGPSDATLGAAFGNEVRGAAAGEVAYRYAFGNGAVLRPFVQGRAGDETYMRIGADLFIGTAFTGGVVVRDESTGQLYQTLEEVPTNGFSFVVGADAAKVFSSDWLPGSEYTLTDFRTRARAGVHWQGEVVGVFYGATWESPEFTAQSSGQVLGSLQVQLSF